MLQFEFDQARLMVAAIQDGKVTPGTLVLQVLVLNLDRHSLGFRFLVAAADDAQWLTIAQLAP